MPSPRLSPQVSAFYGVQRIPDFESYADFRRMDLPEGTYIFMHEHGDWFLARYGTLMRTPFDELPKEIKTWALILNLQERK